MFIDPIRSKSFQAADCYRTIELPPVAFLLARVVTNTPDRGRKGIVLFDHIECLFISSSLDQGNVSLGARFSGAGVLAGAGSSFGDEKGIGNGLGIRPVNGLSLIQSLIEFIGKEDGADLCTVVATGAFLHIDVTGMFSNCCLKMSSLSFQRDQFRVCNDFNIEV